MKNLKTMTPRKPLNYFLILLLVFTLGLALTPHYSCACGEIVKRDGSVLSHFVKKIAEEGANAVRSIFN